MAVYKKKHPNATPAEYLPYGILFLELEKMQKIPCKECKEFPCSCGKSRPFSYDEFIDFALDQKTVIK
jgi:hypothetical protein